MFTLHQHCRACGCGVHAPGTKSAASNVLVPVLDLGLQPLANDFRQEHEEHAGWAPLKVMLCSNCGMAQLSVTVNPSVLYSHYSYVTSHSQIMLEHFEVLREAIIREATAVNSVLEIGSNDGTLLAFLKNNPFETVLGCDPAENLAVKANKRGVPTFCGLFTEENCDCHKKKDVVIARHVMCHIDDWHDLVRGLEKVSHEESLLVIEVPYYKDMLSSRSWDQCYHEHTSYMSIGAMKALLSGSSLHLHKIEHYPVHGGAIVIYLRRNESHTRPDKSVDQYLEGEVDQKEQWQALGRFKDEMVFQMKKLVENLVQSGKRVCGYGASAKSTMWINACGFSKKDICYVTDNTHEKMYRFCPGTDIQVVPEGMLTADMPDYAICFCWNYFSDVYEKERLFRKAGCRWILPVPEVKVVE